MIPTIAIVVSLAAFMCVLVYLKGGLPKPAEDEAIEETVAEAPQKPAPVDDYTRETNYKGNLSQFPDLYQYPFGKTDAYIMNKDFYNQHYEIFEECERDATLFMESLFNVNYRDILANQNQWLAKVMTNADYMANHTSSPEMDDEDTTIFYDYIKQLSNDFIRDQVEMEAKFYTDDSLVYSDYYVFVRGELVFTIYSSTNESLEYELGKEYAIPIDVAIERFTDDPDDHVVVNFGKASETDWLYTP